MEIHSLPLHEPPCIDRAEIDTARPFRSVKEAVTIFGERILVAQKSNIATSSNSSTVAAVAAATAASSSPVVAAASSSSTYSPSSSHSKPDNKHEHKLIGILQKLEAELEETKRELKLLKERESETEVALASLNAELHKNMSKMAEAEAAAARAAAKSGEEKKKERRVKSDHSPCLAQILKIEEKEEYFEMTKKQRKMMKKKPIIPLIGDMFSKKKSSMSLYNPAPYKHSQAYAS